VRHHLERLRLPALTLAALTLLLALSAFTSAPTFAQAPQSQQISVTVNGHVYMVALNTTLKLPTTYADGSKGSVGFTPSAQPTLATNVAVTPYASGCKTAYATQTFYNAFGGVLASFTISQYWCYDGTDITYYTSPGDSYSTGYGWSLANATVNIVSIYAQWGHTDGTFRFNGPFGIGCKSGQNTIYWYGTGNFSTQFNQNSYYGC
jgi:hypothetical protein